jgi:RHS repeat-associated protein
MEMTRMRVIEVIVLGAVLCMGLVFGPQSLGVDVDFLEGIAVQQSYADHSFDTLRHFAMQDGISASYVYGPQGVLAKRTTVNQETTTFFYHLDNLGSVRLVTDDEKNIVVSATYHPFGETSVQEGSERYLFTGKEKDTTELYYYRARYYDPEIGRFLTRDTYTFLPNDSRLLGSAWETSPAFQKVPNRWLENSQALNRYTYALNNPLRYSDPTGLLPKCCDDECEYLCESNDETHSRTGNSTICDEEGYPLPPKKSEDPPEKPEDPDKKTALKSYCDECDCMENEDVKELIKEKKFEENVSNVAAGIGLVACAVFGGFFGFFSLGIGIMMGVYCGAMALDAVIERNKEMDEKFKNEFSEAGCECAYMCS